MDRKETKELCRQTDRWTGYLYKINEGENV